MSVIFDEVRRYDVDSLRASLRSGLDGLGLNIRGRTSAFVKINAVRPARPGSAVITHPAVVEALVDVLRENGVAKIVIGEGPAAGVDVGRAFRKSGFTRLCRRLDVPLLDLHRAPRVPRPWEFGILELPAALVESDLYINVAKMKTHFHTGLTLSVKNQQGLLTPAAKKANHRENNLHQSLVAISRVVKPNLVIVDGIDAMEGEGPTKGRRKHVGVMVYGDDLFATDLACARFMGVPLRQVDHLRRAVEEGLADPEPAIVGEAFARLRKSFALPSPKPKRILNFYSWKNYRACAEDEHCFEEALHLALVRPRYWFTFFPRFLRLVLLGRLHLLRGREAQIPSQPGRVLCIGDCSEAAARRCGAAFVPGCPPKPEDILETVSRMK